MVEKTPKIEYLIKFLDFYSFNMFGLGKIFEAQDALDDALDDALARILDDLDLDDLDLGDLDDLDDLEEMPEVPAHKPGHPRANQEECKKKWDERKTKNVKFCMDQIRKDKETRKMSSNVDILRTSLPPPLVRLEDDNLGVLSC